MINKKFNQIILSSVIIIVLSIIIGLTPAGATGQFNKEDNMEEALSRLHTHEQIKRKLLKIQWKSQIPIQVGPLIKNGANGGLINIDRLLRPGLNIDYNVCGDGQQSTIREAVICTVPVGERGNRDPYKIGFSTQGRELWALRMGNPYGVKVVYWTQQHGNEVAATEAVLEVVKKMVTEQPFWARQVLAELDILIVVRANPDGGEVGDGCFLPPYIPGSVVGDSTCGLTRYNVDPMAGGAFEGDSEEGFFGVVGRGYDLNRYHFPMLDQAIRPVETQALVASMLAFQPKYLLDLHGDIGKTVCDIDLATVQPNPFLNGIPSAECIDRDGTDIVFSMLTGISPDGSIAQRKRRKLGANIIRAIDNHKFGRTARFAQIQVGTGVINRILPYSSIDILHLTWESYTINAVGLGVSAVIDEQPITSLITDTGFDPKILLQNIKINKIAFRVSLRSFARFARRIPRNDGEYCQIPASTGLMVQLQEASFGPNPHADEPVLVPFIEGLVPFQFFDDCQ